MREDVPRSASRVPRRKSVPRAGSRVPCRLALIVSFALMAGALLAQTPPAPAIESISPSSGSIRGGTKVTITGKNFDAAILCLLPCPTVVLFDGTPAIPAGESTDTRIEVLTPAHKAGVVEVKVQRPDNVSGSATFQYVSTIADQYVKVLLPIYTEAIPGIGGSSWQTRFLVHNSSTRIAYLAHAVCRSVCPAVYPLTYALMPGETAIDPDFFKRKAGEPPGRLIYISREAADEVALALRVQELSREARSYGTEVPVVRENEFRERTIVLLDVPTDARFRRTLRLYETANVAPVPFTVQVFELTGKMPLLEFPLTTATTNVTTELAEDPGYAQIVGFLEGAVEVSGVNRLRVEITPVSPGALFWAFITVTNNETQQVTTVSPQ